MINSPSDVVVIGGGIAGLVAARRLAIRGFAVRIIEASSQLGGTVRGHTVGGITLDSGVDAGQGWNDSVAGLLRDLDLTRDVVEGPDAESWVHWTGQTTPFPQDTFQGIPRNVLARDVVNVIGWCGAARAFLDRLKPVLTIGHTVPFGQIVRSRMGQRVCDRLLDPVMMGRFGVGADELDARVLAPGLGTALTRTGSLAGAVIDLLSEATEASTMAREWTLRGGMFRLVEALVADLVARGVTIEINSAVRTLRSVSENFNETDELTEAGVEKHADVRWTIERENGDCLSTRGVVLAVPMTECVRLTESLPETREAASDFVGNEDRLLGTTESVTLVVKSRELTRAERTRVYVARDAHDTGARLYRNLNREWPWIGRELAPDYHVVRMEYSHGDRASNRLEDDVMWALARRDIALLAGVSGNDFGVRAMTRVHRENSIPRALLGHRENVREIREKLERYPTLRVTGSWCAGTEVAHVIDDADNAARGIRRITTTS